MIATRPWTNAALLGAALASGCAFSGPDGGVDPPVDARIDARMDAGPTGRVIDDHLVGLWRFAEGSGTVAADTTAAVRPGYAATPMSFAIEGGTVAWVPGGLRIDGPAQIRTGQGRGLRPHLYKDVNTSGAVTIELWVTPAAAAQGTAAEPAAIFALGAGAANCSVRIAQGGDRYAGCAKELRLASDRGPERPLASAAGTARAALQHVVLVAGPQVRALYVDGVAHPAPAADLGALSGWIDAFRLSLGAEIDGTRPWRGTVWFAAAYDRALTADEIARNRAAGHDCAGC